MPSAIYYQQTGSQNTPPLVVLHGLFGSLENLGGIVRQLEDCFHVYSLDLPDHGRSHHNNTISLATMAEAVVTWMSEMQLDNAHFLGHSLGGKVAMEIALRYPEKINQLVVADIAPVTYSHRHHDIFDALNAVKLSTLRSRADADKQMQPHISEPTTRSFLLKNLKKNDTHWFWRMNLTGLIASYDELITANTHDYPAFLGKTLFLKGELSSYILPEHQNTIQHLFPNANVNTIKGTQHWLHVEEPLVFAQSVRHFLHESV